MASDILHIFLDTSVLSNAPKRDNAAFGAIERLVATNDLVVHVSEVTVQEFVSQEEAHFETCIEQIRNQLRTLRRRLPNREPALATMKVLQQSADSLAEQLALSAKNTLPNWLQATGATVHGPKPDHGARILAGYFGGHPPFKNKKKREDFPDAFIFASIQDLAAACKPIHVVAADNALREATTSLEGVIVHASLDDFVKSPACQERLQKANVQQNMDLLRSCLQDDSSSLDHIVVDRIAAAIEGKDIESGVIPDDNNVATISGVDEPSVIKYDIQDTEYYGNGVVVIPFEATAEVLADYFIFKSDYYCLDEDRSQRISISDSNWNDHYMAVQEYFTVRVSGRVSVTLDQNFLVDAELDEERITSAILAADGEIDEIFDMTITSPNEESI